MALEPGDHGSTFGGNALTCAAAFASTKHIIENDLPQKASEMGKRLVNGLTLLQHQFPCISQIRGIGLLVALEFQNDISGNVVSACNEEGLLLNAVKPNAIRFMPPLTITSQEIDEGIDRLEQALKKL